jgi:hypothetical protein
MELVIRRVGDVMDDIPNIMANIVAYITTNIIVSSIIMDGIHPQTSTFHPLYIHNVIKNLPKKIPILKHLELV